VKNKLGSTAARRESGFTIIELIMSLVIMAALFAGVTAVFIQIYKITAASNNHLHAIRNVQNIGQYVVRDGQQAKTVECNEQAVTGGIRYLELSWDYSAFSLGKHTIDYVLLDSGALRRDDYAGGAMTPTSSQILAENVDAFYATGSSLFEVTVSSTVGGFQSRNAEIKYYFNLRVSPD
jgi:prepilin-type N-terminal cleavage/methylation domain-containing protein